VVKENAVSVLPEVQGGYCVSGWNLKHNSKRKLYKFTILYELVVCNPSKGASPLPFANYLTCDHTTAYVCHILRAGFLNMT